MNRNVVGWFEIYVSDMPRAVAFYELVLGVTLEKLPPPPAPPEGPSVEMMCFPMSDDGPGAGGALAKMDGVTPGGAGTLVYFSCEDCATEENRVEAAGGHVVQPKFSIGPYGFMSLAVDTEGNTFGLHSRA